MDGKITLRQALEMALEEAGVERDLIKTYCDSFFKRINDSFFEVLLPALTAGEKMELEKKLGEAKGDHMEARRLCEEAVKTSANNLDFEVLKKRVEETGLDAAWDGLRKVLSDERADKFNMKFDELSGAVVDL